MKGVVKLTEDAIGHLRTHYLVYLAIIGMIAIIISVAIYFYLRHSQEYDILQDQHHYQLIKKVLGNRTTSLSIAELEREFNNSAGDESCVYLIKSGPYYKIGRTKDYKRRSRDIKLQLPFEVEEIHRIQTRDTVNLEGYWHDRFRHCRKNGEWFTLTKKEVEEFCEYIIDYQS